MRWRPENNKKRACNTETFGKDRQKETAAVRNKCTHMLHGECVHSGNSHANRSKT